MCLWNDAPPGGTARRSLGMRTDRQTPSDPTQDTMCQVPREVALGGSLGIKGGAASLQPRGTPKMRPAREEGDGTRSGGGRGSGVSLSLQGVLGLSPQGGAGHRVLPGAVPARVNQFLARYLGREKKERKKLKLAIKF